MSDFASVVSRALRGYTEQGVFQACSESAARSGKRRFTFRWLLGHEFCLVLDPGRDELVVKDVLPGIEHRSFIDRDLRAFVASRADPGLPPHRRVAAEVAALTYTNRKQQVSLVLQVHDRQFAAALKSLLTVLNDLFSHLHLHHIDYLHRRFGLPEE